MLYQPSYPSPYLSDIDGKQTNEFSCYINADGGTKVTSYKYVITTDSGESIYQSSIITLSKPLYSGDILSFTVPSTVGLVNGVDYLWSVTLYTEIADIWITYGTCQGIGTTANQHIYIRPNQFVKTGMYMQIGAYRGLITDMGEEDGKVYVVTNPSLYQYANNNASYNIYNNNITSTSYYFKARTTPTLTLATIPSIVDSKSYTFKATYEQNENIGYKYFEWIIYNRLGEIINRSGEISAGVIEYTFDGFINSERYGVSLVLENQDGIILNQPTTWFDVQYAQPQIDNPPTATVNCENDSIDLMWSPLLINRGEAISETSTSPQYDFLTNEPYIGGNSVRIADGTNIIWNIGSTQSPLYIPYESTTFINWHTTDDNFSGIIYKQEGEYIDLVAMSSNAPVSAKAGDKYYNTTTKLIYTAISTNIWDTTGVSPRNDVIYNNTGTNLRYLWDDINEDMEATNYTNALYKLSYQGGSFIYEISNGDINKQETVQMQPLSGDLSDYWFKIALLPNKVIITALEIMATTWNDLRNYTWNDLRSYTWNELRYNKI